MANTNEAPRSEGARAGSAPRATRRLGPVLRAGLALALIGKLALGVLWYLGGVSAAVALATEMRATRPHASTTRQDAATTAREPGESRAGVRLAAASGPRGDAGAVKAAGPSDDAPRAHEAPPARVASAAGGESAAPGDVRALVAAISRRQTELDERERDIAAREERLRLFEQDVTAKIASLEEIEARLQSRAKAASAAVDAAAESLAKVYGAMKPADAAPILERLDESTVLTIFGRMKEKQIGEILPLMSKDKAITLTHALATSAPR